VKRRALPVLGDTVCELARRAAAPAIARVFWTGAPSLDDIDRTRARWRRAWAAGRVRHAAQLAQLWVRLRKRRRRMQRAAWMRRYRARPQVKLLPVSARRRAQQARYAAQRRRARTPAEREAARIHHRNYMRAWARHARRAA